MIGTSDILPAAGIRFTCTSKTDMKTLTLKALSPSGSKGYLAGAASTILPSAGREHAFFVSLRAAVRVSKKVDSEKGQEAGQARPKARGTKDEDPGEKKTGANKNKTLPSYGQGVVNSLVSCLRRHHASMDLLREKSLKNKPLSHYDLSRPCLSNPTADLGEPFTTYPVICPRYPGASCKRAQDS
jgi:hypothetical protein